MEGKNTWHGSPVDDESRKKARPELLDANEAALASIQPVGAGAAAGVSGTGAV